MTVQAEHCQDLIQSQTQDHMYYSVFKFNFWQLKMAAYKLAILYINYRYAANFANL